MLGSPLRHPGVSFRKSSPSTSGDTSSSACHRWSFLLDPGRERAMTKSQPPRGANQILARLPEQEYSRLRPHLKPFPLEFKQILCEANAPIEHVWFPEAGVLSAVTVMRNGSAIEAANIGNEGVFGWSAIFGAATSPQRVIVQVRGEGLKIKAASFKE